MEKICLNSLSPLSKRAVRNCVCAGFHQPKTFASSFFKRIIDLLQLGSCFQSLGNHSYRVLITLYSAFPEIWEHPWQYRNKRLEDEMGNEQDRRLARMCKPLCLEVKPKVSIPAILQWTGKLRSQLQQVQKVTYGCLKQTVGWLVG